MSNDTSIGARPSKYDPNEIFAWIVAYKKEHNGNSPAVFDIMHGCRVSSKSVVFALLRRLEDAGRIRLGRRCGLARSIEVVGGTWTPPARV